MRRPASTTPPSLAHGSRAVTESAHTSSLSSVATASGKCRHTRKWLLSWVVLGFFAAIVLCLLSPTLWFRRHSAQNLQAKAKEPHSLLRLHQNESIAGIVDVEAIAEKVNGPKEDTERLELERKQDNKVGMVTDTRKEEGGVDLSLSGTVDVADSDVITTSLAGATRSALTRTTPFVPLSSIGVQVRGKRRKPSMLSQQIEAVLSSDKKEERGKERWEEKKFVGKDATGTRAIAPTIDESIPLVQHSQGFTSALEYVYSHELSAVNRLSNASLAGPGDVDDGHATMITKLRNSTADRDLWTSEDYQHELLRLEGIKREAIEESDRLKNVVSATDELLLEERDRSEDRRAASTVDIRLHQPRKIYGNLKCMGWRQTGQCSPYGKREPGSDTACRRRVQAGVSGYCELLDENTGESFRAMQLNCSSLRGNAMFSCADAANFTNFGPSAQDVYGNALAQNRSDPSKLLGNSGSGDGIVIVVYPKVLASVFASVNVLRSHNCTLPIELWVSQPEVIRDPRMITALEVWQQRFSNVTVETIIDPNFVKFSTKIYAIQHSKFENVLFLDADNIPVRDPTFLFDSQEYREHGAIFWPDFWHPDNTVFNIHRESLLWQLVDLPFVDMFEQESGQMLINRKRAAVALEVLMFFASHRPNYFSRLLLAHGDKDLFRLAWMKAHTSFYMVPFPPGLAGPARDMNPKSFCGVTMVQFDLDGNVLFLHRNGKKLGSTADHQDSPFWTHLLSLKGNVPLAADNQEDVANPSKRMAAQRLRSYKDLKQMYRIASYAKDARVREDKACYGANFDSIENFDLTEFKDQPFANLEQEIIAYAREAYLLMA
ncbi:unnamed protein product [Hyaloperonospora brassicae]|uniref:Uncharacterized protein n=1 Tax=Hyaloperonospora brassicae TaxID=162125 RepID=A0AAV0UY32_HYABA|nr:unnamed protein product [Hyaloperonospora brassicae]